MTVREKTLGIVVVGILGCGLLYAIVSRFVLAPMAEADRKIGSLREDNEKLEKRNSGEGRYERVVASVGKRMYGRDPGRVRELIRAKIMLLAKRSGLDTREHWDMTPVTGRQRRDYYSELGWSVRGRGRLKHVVNFLYLLNADPHVHRVSNLRLMPVARSDDIKMQVKYTTIVPEGKTLRYLRGVEPSRKLKEPDLNSRSRARYNAIVLRDLFRPYRKRPPIVARAPGAPAAFEKGELRVVSLSQMAEQPDIGVRDTLTGAVRYYRPGDRLGDGRIVLVDYRKMPLPDRPGILSESRVIVRIGSAYWAVELGQAMADKRKLKPTELPEELRISPTTKPGSKKVPSGPEEG